MMRLTMTAVCALAGWTLFAGIGVEVADREDRTLQIAADEFRKFYRALTGREATGDRRLLLSVDKSLSADGYDAFPSR